MMRYLRFAFSVTLVVVASAADAQKVRVDYDWDVDFSQYKTFAWGPTIETSLRDDSVYIHSYLKNAIEYRLVAGGLTEVPDAPDLLVTYHTGITRDVQINTISYGYTYGPGWHWDPFWGGAMFGASTNITTYERGTLVIDIWDAKTERIVWRGSAVSAVPEQPAKAAKKIDKIIEKIAKRFNDQYRKGKKKLP